MTSVHLPLLEKMRTLVFSGCTALTVVALPSLYRLQSYNNFQSCNSLVTADFGGALEKLTTFTFNSSAALRNLILRRSDAVVPLDIYSVNALGGIYSNPTASTIYVPSSLITQYQQASNWSTGYAAGLTFSAIENSQYKDYYADGTPVSGGGS